MHEELYALADINLRDRRPDVVGAATYTCTMNVAAKFIVDRCNKLSDDRSIRESLLNLEPIEVGGELMCVKGLMSAALNKSKEYLASSGAMDFLHDIVYIRNHSTAISIFDITEYDVAEFVRAVPRNTTRNKSIRLHEIAADKRIYLIDDAYLLIIDRGVIAPIHVVRNRNLRTDVTLAKLSHTQELYVSVLYIGDLARELLNPRYEVNTTFKPVMAGTIQQVPWTGKNKRLVDEYLVFRDQLVSNVKSYWFYKDGMAIRDNTTHEYSFAPIPGGHPLSIEDRAWDQLKRTLGIGD